MDFSLLQLFLLFPVFYKVASAPESVFVLEGNSVILTTKKNDSLDPYEVAWTFNQSSNIVKYYPHYNASRHLRISAPFNGRVEFDNTTFSLELKKLRKNDSGLYTQVIPTAGETTIAEYRLFVYEPVSVPVLTVKPVPSSGDLWNVSCSAGNLSQTSTCNRSTCTQEELTALSRIIILIKNLTIICNHSNPLSWKHSTETVLNQRLWNRDPLWLNELEFPSVTKQRVEWVLMTIAGGLGGLLICGVVYVRAHLKNQAGSLSSVIYQSVEILDKNQSEIACVKNTQLLSSVEHPPTIYWKIQPHTGLNEDVECIYSLIQNASTP